VLTGLFELETHRYIKKWNDYEWMIDVGAGTGELCLVMLKRKPYVRNIFVIEPNNNEVQRMKLNLELNPELDVTKITIMERIGARTAAGELRLDDFELLLGTAPGIIKIDVEGVRWTFLMAAIQFCDVKMFM